MCGICGWVCWSGNTIDSAVLNKMVSVLQHRGPDDMGCWYFDQVALGHTRLSIIDLKNGVQPMIGDNGWAVVFNGEIYNYREIRRNLIDQGAKFRTESDTEVILEAYKKWGEHCVNRFDGMFSFVISDPYRKRLFLARDYFGKKPLHYFHHQGVFIFASEIKSILQHDVVRSSVDVDDRSLVDYLSIGYILSPKTIFDKISRFPPASWGYVDWESGSFRIQKYWRLEDHYKLPKIERNIDDQGDEFLDIFSNAVKTRLHADVPVGAFLSSGLDSSSVVATAMDKGSGPLRAFNIGFREESYDESNAAREIAASLGVDLKVRYFEDLVERDISLLVWHFDEPFSDNSAQPTFQLNRLASEFGKVALSGDGADELFAGYPTYRADQFFRAYRKAPLVVQKAMLGLANKWLKPSYRKVSTDYKVRQFLGSAGLTPQEAHYWWRVIFQNSEIEMILSDEMLSNINGYDPFHTFQEHFQSVKGLPFLDQTLYVDTQTWLLDDILIKVDRMSMAHSVEVRCPFLDRQLAEFAARLPTRMKMNGWMNKVIIRKNRSKTVPSVARMGTKQGFNCPPINNMRWSLPRDPRFRENFTLNPKQEDVTFKSYNLLALGAWFDMFKKYKETGRWEPSEQNN